MADTFIKSGFWVETIKTVKGYLNLNDLIKRIVNTDVLPLQSGNSGKVLGTNGTTLSWTSNDTTITTNTQTASYILALTDAAKLVNLNVGSANTITVPPSGTVNFPIGTQIMLASYGAGQTTIVAGLGVTIRSAGAKLKLASQYSGASLTKIAADEWYIFGDLSL